MKHFTKMKFFLLIRKNGATSFLYEVQDAYEEFAFKLLNEFKAVMDISELYYNLSFVRLELVEVRENPSERIKKNALAFIVKAIALVETTQHLLQWNLQNRKLTSSIEDMPVMDIQWTGSVADLVEFAYGALETKKFNHGDIDENCLVEYLCRSFSFEVKDCYDTFRAIRRRAGSRTFLLDEMKEKLNKRMDDMDNGIFKKKKVRK